MLPLFPCSGLCRFFLLTILLTVAESQILTDRIVCVVDLLTTTAGLQIDLHADIVDGHALQAQTDDLRIARVFPVEMCEELNLQFVFRR